MKVFAAVFALGLAAQTIGQTTTPTREQWEALSSDISSYAAGLVNDPEFLSLGEALESELPPSMLSDISKLVATTSLGSGIPYAELTATPTVSWGSLTKYIDPSLRSEIATLAISMAQAEQSILTKDLSYTGGVPTATASSPAPCSDAVRGWMLGISVGAVGMAAALL